MTFHVGQKVVCISEFEESEAAKYFGVALPIVNDVYTVRNLVLCDEGELGLRVAEITNPEVTHRCGTYAEPAFSYRCFRPAVEKKTDISIFTDLLIPTKEFVNG